LRVAGPDVWLIGNQSRERNSTGMSLPTLPTPTLRTERLQLRPFADTDADDLFTLQSSAYVLRY
jgi:hypothetical protein